MLAFAPAAVIIQQAAPAGVDRRTVGRRDGADIEFLESLNKELHLSRHRRHQAVVKVPSLHFGAAAVGLRPGFGA